MSIAENVSKLKAKLPQHVKLIVVTKTRTEQELMEVYHTGHRLLGESRVQELLPKHEALPKDIEWHLVGHLQTNKVKYIAPFIGMIHSIDSLKLLRQLDKEGRKNERVINCLLQMHIADEQSKFGLSFQEACSLLDSTEYKEWQNIRICGLMGMGTLTDDIRQTHREFRQLHIWYNDIKTRYFPTDDAFCELSMGMSDDFGIALKEGSTMIRVGSAIFA
jgi:PLP dependent protein